MSSEKILLDLIVQNFVLRIWIRKTGCLDSGVFVAKEVRMIPAHRRSKETVKWRQM